jgi:hypothetical protein
VGVGDSSVWNSSIGMACSIWTWRGDGDWNIGKYKLKTCFTAAQDRKGLIPAVLACNIKLSFLLSFLNISMIQAPSNLRDVAVFSSAYHFKV